MMTFLNDFTNLLNKNPRHFLVHLVFGEGLSYHMVLGARLVISFKVLALGQKAP